MRPIRLIAVGGTVTAVVLIVAFQRSVLRVNTDRDTNAISWGTYTNEEYGIRMEYPYSSTLSPYLIGRGQSASYGTTSPNSIMIGFGAPYKTKTLGLENYQNYPSPLDTRTAESVWRVAVSIEDTSFASSDGWLAYKATGDPYPREVIEKQTVVAGEKAYITYHFADEFGTLPNTERPSIPQNPIHSRTIGFVHKGRLFTIFTLDMALEDVERIGKSVELF